MISKNKKIYKENGREYSFCFDALVDAISDKAKENRTTKENIMIEIAKTLSVSVDAVKNWKKGYNSPSDIEMIRKMAEMLCVDVDELLLVEKDEIKAKMNNIHRVIADELFEKFVEELYVLQDRYIEIVDNGGEDKADWDAFNAKIRNDMMKMRLYIDQKRLKLRKFYIDKFLSLINKVELFLCGDEKLADEWYDAYDSHFWYCYYLQTRSEALDDYWPENYILEEEDYLSSYYSCPYNVELNFKTHENRILDLNGNEIADISKIDLSKSFPDPEHLPTYIAINGLIDLIANVTRYELRDIYEEEY